MEQITGATSWNINSDEADALDYNTDFGRPADIFDGTTPYRTSDHDPLLIGLVLYSPLFGDLDGDDDVDRKDIVALILAIVFRAEIDMEFDLNGDGKVTIRDALLLKQYCSRAHCAEKDKSKRKGKKYW